MTVFVLIVEHRHGQNVAVHKTRAEAEANLDSYVVEWWSDLGPGIGGDPEVPMPDNATDRIARYFGDHPDNEYYSIEEAEVME